MSSVAEKGELKVGPRPIISAKKNEMRRWAEIERGAPQLECQRRARIICTITLLVTLGRWAG